MLELRNPELEVVHVFSGSESELLGQAPGHVSRLLAYPASLAAPASERVRESGTHLVPLDSDTPREIVRDVVDAPGRECECADPGEGQLLERAPVVIAFGHVASRRVAADAAHASTRLPET